MPAQTHWYDILKASSHEALTEAINTAAAQGWEPVQCWSAGKTVGGNSLIASTDHFCLVRIPVEAATAVSN